MEDQYKISQNDYEKYCGYGLLQKYNKKGKYGIRLLLQETYPEYNWCFWKFSPIPKEFWESIDNQKAYIKWLLKEVTNSEDIENCYKITSIICYSLIS